MRRISHISVLILLLSSRLLVAYRYIVTTYTGDRFGAGTDARVFAKLFGAKGTTDEKELESSGRDNFERGQLDTFLLKTKDVGKIKKVEIRHDNSWLGPGWFLEKLTVTSEEGDYYEFPVHKWFDKNQDDGKTTREVIPRPIQKKDQIEFDDSRQPLDCSWPQGISNGKIADSQISASTSFNDLHLPYHARLGVSAPNSLGGWCPYKDDKSQYLQVDLGRIKRIAGVATQGMAMVDEWTTSYRITYSNSSDGTYKEYTENGNYVKNFIGNNDQNGTVQHWLKKPFVGRYVRILPFRWYGKGCLRAELYGCPVQQESTERENAGYIQLPEERNDVNSDETKTPSKEQGEDEQQTTTAEQEPPSKIDVQLSTEAAGERHAKIPAYLNGGPRINTVNQSLSFTENTAPMAGDSSLDIIPVVHLDFDDIRDGSIPDVSGHHNDAHIRLPIDIMSFSKSCEKGIRINGGDVYFDGEFFIDKPREEITIAAWIKLFSNGGQHSIFDTVGGKASQHSNGQYHFEVDRGALRWFHRNEVNHIVFNISSPLMIPAHVWTHCAATYSTSDGKAAVFINGKLGNHGYGTGSLSQDWTGRTGIGQHKGQRVLNGEIDEFYIFNKALTPSKISQLMKRCSFETDCQSSLGMQSKEIKDTQVSASSTYNLHKPHYGRVNLASFGGDPARTAWCASKDDKNPYLQIDLPELTSLTGVASQGLSIFDNWVTSYLFCYSKDKALWNCYKEKGYDKVFEANSDKNSIKRHYFHHPVDGNFVRIRPQSWYGNHLCMRIEIYGCQMDLLPDAFDSFGSLPVFMEDTEAQIRTEISPKESCNNPLGISNGEVDDTHITASSSLDSDHLPLKARLVRESVDPSEIKGCWCAHDVNLRQYIEVDLGERKTITGIATQGYVSHDNWVSTYRLGYSDDTTSLEWYRENDDERLFPGNLDRSGIIKHFLKAPVEARYVRLNPRAWHGIHICMRFEFFGCKEGPSVLIKDSTFQSNNHHLQHAVEPVNNKQLIPTTKLKVHKPRHLNPAKRVKSGEIVGNDVFHVAKSVTPVHVGTPVGVNYPQPVFPRPAYRNVSKVASPPMKLFLTKSNKPKLVAVKLVKGQHNKAGVVEAKEVKFMRKKSKNSLKGEEEDLLGQLQVNKAYKGEKEDLLGQLKGKSLEGNLLGGMKNMNSEGDLLGEMKSMNPEGNLLGEMKNMNSEDNSLGEMKNMNSEGELLGDLKSMNPEGNSLSGMKSMISEGDLLGQLQRMGTHSGTQSDLPSKLKFSILKLAKEKLIEDISHMQSEKSSAKKSAFRENANIPCNDVSCEEAVNNDQAFHLPNLPTTATDEDPANLMHPPTLRNDEQPANKKYYQQPNVNMMFPMYPNIRNKPAAPLVAMQPQQRIYPQAISRPTKAVAPALPLVLPQTPAPLTRGINAKEILTNFPELIVNGITEDILHRLSMRVPNLEQRIYAHFARRNPIPPTPQLEVPNNVYLTPPRLQYMKKIGAPQNVESDFSEASNAISTYTNANRINGNMVSGFNMPAGSNNLHIKPVSIQHTAQHGGLDKDRLRYLESFHDTTKYTPPHMTANGPDPRFVEYYNRYLQGKYMPDEPLELPKTEESVQLPPMSLQSIVAKQKQALLHAAETPLAPAPALPTIENTKPAVQPPAPDLSPLSLPPVEVQPDDQAAVAYPTKAIQSSYPDVPEPETEPPPPPKPASSHWTPFSVCSVTCGRGKKKRFRRCLYADCPPGGVEIDVLPCGEKACDDGDPYEWSPFSPCSVTCGIGNSVRYRVCRTANCPDDGFESEQVTCYKPNCPLCILDFEVVQNHMVIDQSGYRNYAYLDAHVKIREHSQICGHYADLSNLGEILFSAPNFIGKPRAGITMAAWINIQGTVTGKHSIFSTVRRIGKSFIGGYHFEVDDGRVRWFHRDENGVTIFNMVTDPVISPGVWMHVAGTYDAYKRVAKVYVDGKDRGSKEGSGLLAGDWGYKASIGFYDFDDRRLNGWLDEFLIYDFAMLEEEVFKLLGKMRCPISNITSVEIDAFEFENINMKKKRAIAEDPKYDKFDMYQIHKTKKKSHLRNSSRRSKRKLINNSRSRHRRDIPSGYLLEQTIKPIILESFIYKPFLYNSYGMDTFVNNITKENPHR